MAKHFISARKKPKAEIKAAPTWYERTHPVGSAERFLDEAAKDALAMAAAGGVPTPKQAFIGAAKAVAKEYRRYPDPLLEAAANLPKEELMRRAARAAAYQKAMDAQNRAVAATSALLSPPVGNMAMAAAASNAAEDLGVRQDAKGGDALTRRDWGGGVNTVSRVEFANTTKAEKERRQRIAQETAERERAEAEYFRSMMDLNNQSAEAMAFRDGPIKTLTPDILEMIALGKPVDWALSAAGRALSAASGRVLNSTIKKLHPPVTRGDAKAFEAIKTDISNWYKAREGVVRNASIETGVPDSVEGYISGVNNARLVDTTGQATGPYSKGLYQSMGDILHGAEGDVALAARLTKANKDTVFHEVGAHAASRGAKSEVRAHARSRMEKTDRAYWDYLTDRKKDIRTPEFKHLKDTAYDAALSYEATFGRSSSAEEMVKLLQTKYNVKIADPKYWDSPSEALGGLWSTRARAGVDPGFTWTKDFVKKLREKGGIIDEDRLGSWSDEALAELANKVPAVASPVVVGEGATKQGRLEGGRAYKEPPIPDVRDEDGSVPFALKAGRTRRNVRAAEGGGDTPGSPLGAPVPEGPAPAPSGPRIVINPQVFGDKRDALCVAFNEAFRLVMEENGFEPVSEPTEKQRRFFADTAYADDELQLRRTILARIATLDTSVSDPTDEQLEETAEMLEMVMEVGAPQSEWEQQAVQRLHDVVAKAREAHAPTDEPLPPQP